MKLPEISNQNAKHVKQALPIYSSPAKNIKQFDAIMDRVKRGIQSAAKNGGKINIKPESLGILQIEDLTRPTKQKSMIMSIDRKEVKGSIKCHNASLDMHKYSLIRSHTDLVLSFPRNLVIPFILTANP